MMDKSEIDKRLENPKLSDAERRMLEIAKSMGLKRLF